ncbi:hypothetical protein FN846DRAFT_896157 [Sphaerosporella brunnea]|uniref:Uncharacterized protein n=1 Tax=Sphaerosporella brunnea TaxID=1250544 RepID=A0A5J5EDB7_9PEZI|nr:hypothetical protein FN846DRAFT_896157 [Sphaerosporella brunnea]
MDYYVPEIAKSVVPTQWRELRSTRNDMAGFTKRANKLIKLLGGCVELDRESDGGLFEDYWLKHTDVAKNEITQLEHMWGAVDKMFTLGDAMNLTNERYLRVGFCVSTCITYPTAGSISYKHPSYGLCCVTEHHTSSAYPDGHIGYGPEPIDLNAIDGKCFRREKYNNKASKCDQPNLRERSHNWRSSRAGGYAHNRGRGSSDRGGYVNTCTGGNRGFRRGGDSGGRFGGNYRVYTIEAGEGDDKNNMQWPIEELEEDPGIGMEDLEGETGGYTETVVSSATTTVPRSGNVTQKSEQNATTLYLSNLSATVDVDTNPDLLYFYVKVSTSNHKTRSSYTNGALSCSINEKYAKSLGLPVRYCDDMEVVTAGYNVKLSMHSWLNPHMVDAENRLDLLEHDWSHLNAEGCPAFLPRGRSWAFTPIRAVLEISKPTVLGLV